LHIDLSGKIIEYTELKDDVLYSSDLLSAHDIVKKIEVAKYDENIKGIILESHFISAGLATINQIGEAIIDFKSSKKEVIGFADFIGDKDYLILSFASKIYMTPASSAGIFLTGVGMNILYYKELFDKIGVEVEVVHAGKFKGAGESYYRNNMSKYSRESLSKIIDDIYEEKVNLLAKNRGIDSQKIKDIYENRGEVFISHKKAIDYKLIDELIYKENLFDKYISSEKQLVKMSKYNKEFDQDFMYGIAVVYFQGQIAAVKTDYSMKYVSAKKIISILDELQNDSYTKGIVIRVDSPGGSALESDKINAKIKEVQKIKPIVISMANVAASGGYYVSANSDYIFCDPFTITGSIGVVGMLPNISKAGAKLGINSDNIYRGKYIGFLNMWKKKDPAAIQAFRNSMEETYFEFKTVVANGRNMKIDYVEEIAQGRVWSSKDAKINGLIDEIGTLKSAIQKTAKLANLGTYKKEYYPKRKSLLEVFVKERFGLETIAKVLFKKNQILEETDKIKSEIEILSKDPVQMVSPVKYQVN